MSIGLVVALLTMTSLALGLLLVPLLLRRRRELARDAYNLAVYRDQLAEIERDVGRGLLSGEQAEAARAEIGRRILPLNIDEVRPGAGPGALVAATLAILMLPPAAATLYWRLGSPALPDQPFAARNAAAQRPVAADGGQAELEAALARLKEHLKTHPDDLTGWLLLARSELAHEHYSAAVEAYRRAVELSGKRADIAGEWGEAQVLAAGGVVTPAARQAFETALPDPESAPRARYYLALAQLQQGDITGALKAWREMAASAPEDAAWLPLVKRRIVEAEGALTTGKAESTSPPDPAAVAAAQKAAASASPEERRAMVDAMVDRLAARLAQQPNDPDGWTRLGRAYLVLQQPDKARDAYARALALRPDDQAVKEGLAEAARAAAKPAATSPGSPKPE